MPDATLVHVTDGARRLFAWRAQTPRPPWPRSGGARPVASTKNGALRPSGTYTATSHNSAQCPSAAGSAYRDTCRLIAAPSAPETAAHERNLRRSDSNRWINDRSSRTSSSPSPTGARPPHPYGVHLFASSDPMKAASSEDGSRLRTNGAGFLPARPNRATGLLRCHRCSRPPL